MLLRRLSNAEKRAGLLKDEIQDLHQQIRELTHSANSILKDCKSNLHTDEPKSRKRNIDTPDNAEQVSKRAKGNIPVVDGYAVVYTDGACENNGQKNAKAGIGAWFSDGHPM